jgi:hypothetical protein
MSLAPKQEAYASNLNGFGRGTAVYRPEVEPEQSGRVGDVAFFDLEGRYQWIRNAFDTGVFIHRESTDTPGFAGMEMANFHSP